MKRRRRKRDPRAIYPSETGWMTPAEQRRYEAQLAELRTPRLTMLVTAFQDQNGRIYLVSHREQPQQVGLEHGQGFLPPFKIVATQSDFALVAESLAHEVDRHVSGSTRAGRLVNRVQVELARLSAFPEAQKPNLRKRIRGNTSAA